MDSNQRLREVANLRFAFQSKSRLRLEFLGELSKILRVHGQTIPDELLASIVVAIPEELPGEGFASVQSPVNIVARPPIVGGGKPPAGKKGPPKGRPPKKGPSKKRYLDETATNVVEIQQLLSDDSMTDGAAH